MNANLLSRNLKQISHVLNKNSPTILTALGIAGFISTVVMAVRATPKAVEAIYQEDNFKRDHSYPGLTTLEKVEITWKYYLPSALMGATSIACIVASTSINNRRNVALTSLFAVAESTLKDYQAKVIETIGEKKEKKIQEELAEDGLKKNPINQNAIIVSGLGDTLCQDQYTGRYFKGDVEHIRKVVNDFNRRLLTEMRISLNDLYSDLGLDRVDGGEYIGWDIEKGLVDLEFYAKLASGNVPCVVVSFTKKPVQLW